MIEFITAVTAITLKYIEAHPDYVHQASQIFRPVADKTRVKTCFAKSVLEKVKGGRLLSATIQMSAGTIL
jgi:hypothetical protein